MYIENAYKGRTDRWMYWFVILSFFGFMGLNLWVSQLLNIDTEALIKQQIATKGEIQFLAENLFLFVVFLMGLLLWVKGVHRLSITNFTTVRKRIDWKRFFFSFSLWAIITIIVTLVDYTLNPQDYIWNFQWESFLKLLAVVVLLVPLQTSFEEYFFRGYVMQGFGVITKTRWFPLIISSVTFGLMHIANPEIGKIGYSLLFYYIGTGFFLGIITLMDEGLELSLGFHAANNMITALLVTSDWTAFQTPSILRSVGEPTGLWDIFMPLLILYPILLLIFAKKYHWSNWRDKLLGNITIQKYLKDDTNL